MTIKFKRVKVYDSPKIQESKTFTIDEEIKYRQLSFKGHITGFKYALYFYFLVGIIPIVLLFVSGGMLRIFETAFKVPITQEMGLTLLKNLSAGFYLSLLFFKSFKTVFWTTGLIYLAYTLWYNNKLKKRIISER